MNASPDAWSESSQPPRGSGPGEHRVKPMAKGERDRQVARVLWLVLGLNVLVASTKLVVGYQVGALSLVADGLHSVLDGSSNVVGLVGIALAACGTRV